MPDDGPQWIYLLIAVSILIPFLIILKKKLGFRDAVKFGMILTSIIFWVGGLFCTYALGMTGLISSGVPVGEIIGLPFLGWALSVLPAAFAGAINSLLRNTRK